MNGKSSFPESHPLSLGTGRLTRTKMVIHFQDKADLVFAIGSNCTKEIFITPVPDDKVLMQSIIDERDINKDYSVERAIIGDAKLVLRQLIKEVKQQLGTDGKKRDNSMTREIKVIKDEWLKEWKPKLTSNEVPINPYRVIWDLMQVLDRNETIMTHDAGNPRDQMVPFYESIIPGGYQSSCPIASERYNLHILSGEYAKITKDLGGYSEKVEQPHDIIPALQRAKKVVDSGQPALIEIITREELNFSKYQ